MKFAILISAVLATLAACLYGQRTGRNSAPGSTTAVDGNAGLPLQEQALAAGVEFMERAFQPSAFGIHSAVGRLEFAWADVGRMIDRSAALDSGPAFMEAGSGESAFDAAEPSHKVDASAMTPEALDAWFAVIAPPRTALIYDAHHNSKLGEMASQLPYLQKAILDRWPDLETLYVVNDYPSVIALVDPRCHGVRTSAELPESIRTLGVDLLIDYSAPEGAPIVRARNWVQSFAARLYQGSGTWPKRFSQGLSSMGFKPAPPASPLVAPLGSPAARIFVNHRAVTLHRTARNLGFRFSYLIESLFGRGWEVTLNAGGAAHDENSSYSLTQSVIGEVRVVGRLLVPNINTVQKLIDEMRASAAVITLDTGVYHLARLLGIPTVVITAEVSSEWLNPDPVIQRRFAYRVVEASVFSQSLDPVLTALSELLLRHANSFKGVRPPETQLLSAA